ncbi:MAG: primase C-terminal domain-containing protein [Actinomycetota bacterium]|nr:primase C-terminal domain-containing protein [Actinomycetota bacterium]
MTDTKAPPTNARGEAEPIERLWRHVFGGEKGLLHLWTARKGADGEIDDKTIAANNFPYPSAAPTAAKHARRKDEQGHEVYFCVHLLTEPKRTKENAAPVRTLWGDLDGCAVPNGGLKPTAVVESSPGRFHAYWRLDDPIPPKVAEGLNKRIANEIGADPSGFDLSQLLRVPGTRNRKYASAPAVKLLSVDANRAFSAGELDRTLPPPEKAASGQLHGPTEPVGEAIANGSRNQTLTSLAGTLRRRDLGEAGIYAALLGINQTTCQPPLPESEVRRIAASVSRYKPGPEAKPSRNGDLSGAVRKWPELDAAALYGLPGEIVRTVDPHTEADPVAVLANLLVAFGNAAGRNAYVEVGADRHHLNLYATLVGKTAKGRKGTSWGPVRDLMHAADAEWVEEQVFGGLSSGEGLINAVRDPVETEGKDGKVIVVDAGAPDKRLLVLESEFAAVLKVMTREGNTLSTIIRQGWDGSKLATLTRNNPLKATGAHLSIIAHVTRDELLKRLSEADTHGGFTNRFLWLCVERSKKLPRGGKWNEVNVAPLVSQLTSALEFARNVGPITWGESGGEMWDVVYDDLSEGEVGLVGAATSRAEAQTLRLAALYACMDESPTIESEHLEAALGLWEYSDQSARFIFGTATGDPVVDRIMEALRENPKGLTRNQINELFGGHQRSERIRNALSELRDAGLVRAEKEPTKGRPVERCFLA